MDMICKHVVSTKYQHSKTKRKRFFGDTQSLRNKKMIENLYFDTLSMRNGKEVIYFGNCTLHSLSRPRQEKGTLSLNWWIITMDAMNAQNKPQPNKTNKKRGKKRG